MKAFSLNIILVVLTTLSACSPSPTATDTMTENPTVTDSVTGNPTMTDPAAGDPVVTAESGGAGDSNQEADPVSTSFPTSEPDAPDATAVPADPSPSSTPILTDPTAPLPQPPERSIMGITSTRLEDPRRAARIAETGAAWVRFDDFYWQDIEPVRTDPPTYNWAVVDEIGLQNAADNGLEVIGLIQFTPDWAQKIEGKACGPIAEDARGPFAEFMAALVERYSAPPFNVVYWEIGNEPDVGFRNVPGTSGFGCWGDERDPLFGGGDYAEMLKRVYPAVKSTNPEAQVLVGGLLLDCDPINPPETEPGSGTLRDCTPAKFLEGVLANGGGDYFDGISFHAYDFYYEAFGAFGNVNWKSGFNFTGEEPVVLAKTRYLKALLSQYRHPDKYLINTETAVVCLEAGQNTFCLADEFQQLKAAYVAQSHATALSLGLRANIWYALDSGWRSTNLEGAALQAFGVSVEILDGFAYAGRVEDLPNVLGYRFVSETQEVWVVWSADFEPHPVDLPGAPIAIIDMLGESLTVNSAFEITLYPIYIVWER